MKTAFILFLVIGMGIAATAVFVFVRLLRSYVSDLKARNRSIEGKE